MEEDAADGWDFNSQPVGAHGSYFSSLPFKPNAPTECGDIARSLCYVRDIDHLSFNVNLVLEPLLFAERSPGDPLWVKEARSSPNGDIDCEEWGDDPDITSREEFAYRIRDLEAETKICVSEDGCADHEFQSLNDLLLVMEGLDWK